MALGKLGQFALSASDVDTAEAFYENTLGLPKLFRFDQLVFFNCDGVRLMIEGGKQVNPSDDICHYFLVDDMDSEVAGLKSRGLEFEAEPHLITKMPDHELWMAFFRDPDGHMLALMEERR